MSITLQDVAKLAGVSIGTASQALNNNPKVTDETRSRVLDAARTLGYVFKERRDDAAQKTPEISVIGVLAKHDVGEPALANPFYSHIISGIEIECRKLGVGLMVSSIEVDPENRPVEWPAMLDSQLVEGLIFLGTQLEAAAYAAKQKLNLPTILVDSYAVNLPFDSIVTDNVQGVELALNHLLSLGHLNIALLGSQDSCPPSIAERRKTYIAIMKERGLFHAQYIANSKLSRAEVHRATLSLLKEHPEITALFACNDDSAAGAMAAAQELGLHVPRDISIVGFDNIALAGELPTPLTTIHIHKNWMGMLGVRFLLERAAHPEKPKTSTLVSTQLVIRESTAPPRRAGST
ncbi:MAG: LacI family DNA-binding transcriptional regulator [Anaerolineales bacterium]